MIGCFFGHRWSRWENQRAFVITYGEPERNIGKTLEQSRRCSRCGKLEMSVQKEYFV